MTHNSDGVGPSKSLQPFVNKNKFRLMSKGKRMNKDLEKRIEILEKEREKRPGRYSSLFNALEKLMIPLALGILGFFANHASNQISNAQLRLAESEVELAKSQFQLAKSQEIRSIQESKTAKQIKYIELFYEDIRDKDPAKQLQALGLLLSLDQDVGTVLATAVKSNPSNNEKVRGEAQKILRSIQKYGPLINYKIGIYVQDDDTEMINFAEALKRAFTRDKFPGTIAVYKKSKDFYTKIGEPEHTQIRYEGDYEEDAAEKLKSLLSEINPKREYHLMRTLQPSQGFLSIFPVGSPDNFEINSSYGTHEELVPQLPNTIMMAN